MSSENIRPERITKPIQLLAAWLLGLILINTSFLTAASQIHSPSWASGLLLIASVINVPLFLASLFLLQTKFRPEMQEDTFYSKYLERRYTEIKPTKNVKEALEEAKKETAVTAELITKELINTSDNNAKEKVELILKEREIKRIEKRIGESRVLSQLYMYNDKWETFYEKWKENNDFKQDLEELFFYKAIDGDITKLSSIKLSELGSKLASQLSKENKLWNQTHPRIID